MNDLKEIANEFFRATNKRPTKATFGITMKQAQALLECGFSKEEIIQGIHYCATHPPKKGFYSLGWLSYVLEDILIKITAKRAIEEAKKDSLYQTNKEVGINANKRKFERNNNLETRYGKGYNFKLFE
jgi:hypothetical protein